MPLSETKASGETAQASWFTTTHWSVVLAAGESPSPKSWEALEVLCRTYWQPLYAFIRRRGANPHEAQDLTQGFFHQFLERDALAGVRPEAGKFRSFLLVCLKNFLANERERAHAQRRGGNKPQVHLDGVDAERRYSLEPSDRLTPEKVFERSWAYAVIEKTIAEQRRECSEQDKSALFQDLQGFLPGGQSTISRAELAARRGVSVGAIDVAIHRLRRRFGELLRRQVAQTVRTEAEVDEELRYLISLLSS